MPVRMRFPTSLSCRRTMDAGSRAVHVLVLVVVVGVLMSLSSAAGAGVAQPGTANIRFTATIGGPPGPPPRFGTGFFRPSQAAGLAAIQSYTPPAPLPA